MSLSLHDRRAIQAIVERMGTDAIGQQLDEGGLSAFACEVIAEELARRVLGGEAHVGGAVPPSRSLARRSRGGLSPHGLVRRMARRGPGFLR